VLKNCLFPWFDYFKASARTFLQGEGILLKLLQIACQLWERQTTESVHLFVVQGISQKLLQASLDGTVCIYAEQF